MGTPASGAWLTISDGAELHCTMQGSDVALVMIEESSTEHELSFDYAAFQQLVRQATAVLAEMEAARRPA